MPTSAAPPAAKKLADTARPQRIEEFRTEVSKKPLLGSDVRARLAPFLDLHDSPTLSIYERVVLNTAYVLWGPEDREFRIACAISALETFCVRGHDVVLHAQALVGHAENMMRMLAKERHFGRADKGGGFGLQVCDEEVEEFLVRFWVWGSDGVRCESVGEYDEDVEEDLEEEEEEEEWESESEAGWVQMMDELALKKGGDATATATNEAAASTTKESKNAGAMPEKVKVKQESSSPSSSRQSHSKSKNSESKSQDKHQDTKKETPNTQESENPRLRLEIETSRDHRRLLKFKLEMDHMGALDEDEWYTLEEIMGRRLFNAHHRFD